MTCKRLSPAALHDKLQGKFKLNYTSFFGMHLHVKTHCTTHYETPLDSYACKLHHEALLSRIKLLISIHATS